MLLSLDFSCAKWYNQGGGEQESPPPFGGSLMQRWRAYASGFLLALMRQQIADNPQQHVNQILLLFDRR